jgi:hypothetical protein
MLRSGINLADFHTYAKGKEKQRTRGHHPRADTSATITIISTGNMLLTLSLWIGFAVLRGVVGDVTLGTPPACYSSCLSNELATVGCAFADVCRT